LKPFREEDGRRRLDKLAVEDIVVRKARR